MWKYAKSEKSLLSQKAEYKENEKVFIVHTFKVTRPIIRRFTVDHFKKLFSPVLIEMIENDRDKSALWLIESYKCQINALKLTMNSAYLVLIHLFNELIEFFTNPLWLTLSNTPGNIL